MTTDEWTETVSWWACFPYAYYLCHNERHARETAGANGWVQKTTTRSKTERVPDEVPVGAA